MPNHVQNILTIKGHRNHVQPMMEHLKEEDSDFSFNKIIPMPKELEGTRAPAMIISEAEYKKQQYEKDFKGEPNPMFATKGAITQKMSDQMKEQFGADNWYDWCIAHWGTKWGCYDVEIADEIFDGDQLTVIVNFQTAWSSGAQAISSLAEQYPTIEFYLLYADEDAGSNTGEIWWKEGFLQDDEIPDYSMENYFKCWGGEEDWVQDEEGEWHWAEDFEEE